MRVVIFRHAEKENSGSSNPPLSERGLEQAEKILEQIDVSQMPRPTRLYSSPKLRAQQTFHPLQTRLGLNLQIHPDLDERHHFESATHFTRRIQGFLQSMEKQPGTTYLVSHLDWLEEAMHLISSDADLTGEKFQTWMPAQSIEFEIQEGLWLFQDLRLIRT